MSATDPRYNAPPRVSDMRPHDRERVLYARAEAHRQTFMAAYAPPVAGVSPSHRRIARALSNVLTIGAVSAAAVLLVVMISRGALSAVIS